MSERPRAKIKLVSRLGDKGLSPFVSVGMAIVKQIDQLHLSVVSRRDVENSSSFLSNNKFLSSKVIAKDKAIEPVWKTLNFFVENCVEKRSKTWSDRGERN